MAEKANSELGALRAEFKALMGKNPSPRLDIEALKAKIAEIKAAAEGGADPAASAGDQAPAEKPAEKPAKGGKAKAKADPADAPEGTVYLKHPEGIGCCYRGVDLKADSKGRVLAPASAADELAAHGFEAL
jgi:hypothetical protein